MSELPDTPFSYVRNMSTLKKVLIVFVILLIFIIIVEQPGTEASKRKKSIKFFIPKLVTEEVINIHISNVDGQNIFLEKKEDRWRITNGRYFPADTSTVNNLLKSLLNLKQVALVSNNPSRMDIYYVDEKKGYSILVQDSRDREIADFFVGKFLSDGQFVRRKGSDEVYQTSPSIVSFLLKDIDGWKDKTLLNVDENDVSSIDLKMPDKNIVLEKAKSGEWLITKPTESKADTLAIRTLFEQLKDFKAESFAESVDGSQADFYEPDYEIKVVFTDGISKHISFSASEEGKYYARNGDANMIYIFTGDSLDKIFGLEFKTE